MTSSARHSTPLSICIQGSPPISIRAQSAVLIYSSSDGNRLTRLTCRMAEASSFFAKSQHYLCLSDCDVSARGVCCCYATIRGGFRKGFFEELCVRNVGDGSHRCHTLVKPAKSCNLLYTQIIYQCVIYIICKTLPLIHIH